MADVPFDSGDIITALIGLGLVIKGILDKTHAKRPPPPPPEIRGCKYGDKAHDELKLMLDRVLTILNERRP